MKIIKVPTYYNYEDIQAILKTLQEAEPDQKYVIIPSDVELIDLSTQDLYRLKEEIEDAIHDHEVISNM